MNDTPSALPAYAATVTRWIATVIAGYLVSKGAVDVEMKSEAIGVLMATVSLLWGIVQKHNAHKTLKTALGA